MISIIVMPKADGVVNNVGALLATVAAGRQIRFTYCSAQTRPQSSRIFC
jgi:hypothetical protein